MEYTDDYLAALDSHQGNEQAIKSGVEKFRLSFADLTDKDIDELMTELYAAELYFNDTIHTFTQRDDLVEYFKRTGEGLKSSRVEIHDVVENGEDVYIRWVMEIEFRAVGKDVHSRSVGMTHLRFNEQGQVILHQDFWDSANALYAHIPMVGFAIRRVQKRL